MIPRIQTSKREKLERLPIGGDGEVERGLNCLELARKFCTQTPPSEAATIHYWPAWAPSINPSPPSSNPDDVLGNEFFRGAIAWILRHELAHIALDHRARQSKLELTNIECEREADLEATRWLRGPYKADLARALGSPPQSDEMQLEWRAIAVGLGLAWVALFEADRGMASELHPPIAERIFQCFDELKLREDSLAAEALHDMIHAWIAPEASWAPAGGYPLASDALCDAMVKLQRHMMQ